MRGQPGPSACSGRALGCPVVGERNAPLRNQQSETLRRLTTGGLPVKQLDPLL
jgi:hypothetical protein